MDNENKNELMNDYISLLKHDAVKMFPGAVSVSIFISADEVTVTPVYYGQLNEHSMRTIDGNLCTKQMEEQR